MSEVSVFKSDADDRDALIAEFFEKFPFYSADDRKRILEAWAFLLEISGDSKNPDGEPYYLHPLRLAFILAEGEFDVDTVISALLHGTPSKGVSKPTIEEKFGREVAKIVFGAAKFINIPVETSKTLLQADAIRKMLFAMTDDVRIIFLKLSDRLDRIRNIKSFAPELQKALATEVIDIWAPLADRLGMQTAKNEFEDLSLKYTNPSAYKQIKNVISQKREERAAYLENAVNTIKSAAEKQRIQVSITSRAKHFYSIYQKMRKRNKDAGELYDLLALRLICQHKSDCYTLIGIVHGLWQPLEGRFKDYIAMPKSNGYQSIHTTVMCDGRPLEIQIRTEKMHEFAEHGVASHWLYKKGTNRDVVDVKNLEIFNQLSKIKEAKIPDDEIFQNYKNELLADEIVVFTPKGDVKKLPIGSTAIDFAYSIHSAIGEKIVGAKADGKIIPLSMELKNTQIIEILTNPNAHPTQSQLKLVKTSKAHQKIHSWLAANDPTFMDREAQAKIEAEHLLRSQEALSVQNERRAHKKGTGFDSSKEVCVAGKVRIGDTSNVFITFAKCCNPKYPEPIAGYVSRNRGITVHRSDCLTYHRIQDLERRKIDVEWDEKSVPQKK